MKQNNNDYEVKKEREAFINIPKDNAKSKIIISLLVIFLVFFGIMIFILKDVLFPKAIKPETPINFPNLELKLPHKYTVNDDAFDAEKEETFWITKNFLKEQLKNKLLEISKGWIGYQVNFVGSRETDNSSHNSNINFLKTVSQFEFLTLKAFSFQYQIVKANDKNTLSNSDMVKTYIYKRDIKLFLTTNKLITKLPEFNSEIILPENIIVDNDNFDSEIANTYWNGKNVLFSNIQSYYQNRNLITNEKDKDLQKYYQPEIIGSLESDTNSNNTNITWELDNNPSFEILTVNKFSFQINVKVRDKLVKINYPITFKTPIKLIINENKLYEKIRKKI